MPFIFQPTAGPARRSLAPAEKAAGFPRLKRCLRLGQPGAEAITRQQFVASFSDLEIPKGFAKMTTRSCQNGKDTCVDRLDSFLVSA